MLALIPECSVVIRLTLVALTVKVLEWRVFGWALKGPALLCSFLACACILMLLEVQASCIQMQAATT